MAYPSQASPSAFLFLNRVGSKKVSSAWAWGGGRVLRGLQELLHPSLNVHLFQMGVCLGSTHRLSLGSQSLL